MYTDQRRPGRERHAHETTLRQTRSALPASRGACSRFFSRPGRSMRDSSSFPSRRSRARPRPRSRRSGTTLWAATPRGVWRLEAGAWTLDGLSARTITSIVVADAVYAADGEKVWKRGADGTWTAETLPAALTFPSFLATDGTAVWAAGIGVAKRALRSLDAADEPRRRRDGGVRVLGRPRRGAARGRRALRRLDRQRDLERNSRHGDRPDARGRGRISLRRHGTDSLFLLRRHVDRGRRVRRP